LILKNISLIHSKGGDTGLMELKEILHLSSIPSVIECFDISNHGEDFAVGSMSRFVDGLPNKSGYRKFKIKTVSGRDDFAMIGEIIKRRYLRLLNEHSLLPDLILIDGGKGQLNSALKSLQSLGLKISCISLAKKNEEIFVPNQRNPIVIPKDKSALKILQYARDETHRFGLNYNRVIRKNQIK
jgi:excinuclease ABC subunit C